ncbi:MAG TPA: DUF6340 family protein [Mucilaginibacter sp.]|jgi:tetratricopeptide (TPR) repeat protein|nr:DUF6340 family protein [Mucilaginibacter sp.]
MQIVNLIGGIIVTLLTFAMESQPSGPAYLTVPVYYAPKNYLGKDSTTIVLINQTGLGEAKISNQKRLGTLRHAAYNSLKTAEIQLKQLPHLRVVNLVDSAGFKTNTDSVKLIAAKYNAQHVLALKNFSADIALSDVQSSTPYFNTDIRADFKLYESNGAFYKKLRGTASDLIPDVKYSLGFYAALYIHPPIEQHEESIDTSAQNATIDALKNYLYSSVSHDRPLYDDHFLKDALKKMYAGDMDAAIVLLKPLLQHKNTKKASKAAYNLAVAYESKGDIETAITMAQLSVSKFSNDYAKTILEDLKTE